jgi:hypothetical protein
MAVARWIGLEIDKTRSISESAFVTGHGPIPECSSSLTDICTIVHVRAQV